MDQIKEIQKLIVGKGPRSLVEIGCAFGGLCGSLKTLNPDLSVTGIDIANGYIKKAKKRFPDIKFKRLDIIKDSLKGHWDMVITCGMFIHIMHEDIEKAISKVMSLADVGIFLESKVPERKGMITYNAREYWEQRVGKPEADFWESNVQYCYLHDYESIFKKLGIQYRTIKEGAVRLYICERNH